MAQKTSDKLFTISSDPKVVKEMIAYLTNMSNAIHDSMHICACSCLIHAIEHGDATLCSTMIESLTVAKGHKSNAWRLNALRDWFQLKGPVTWNEKSKQFNMRKDDAKALREEAAKGKAERLAIIGRIRKTSFWDMKPEAEYKGFDFMAEVRRLIKKAEAAVDEADTGKTKAGIVVDKTKIKVTKGNLIHLRSLLRDKADEDEALVESAEFLEAVVEAA